jgi:hypothetical protein
VRGVTLCEDAWSCERPPGGPLDRVSLTRLAPCGDLTGPLVLYLPDRHQHGDVRATSAREDLRLYLAQAGLRAWALGYRTHTRTLGSLPGATAPAMNWDFDTFADDVEWTMRFIRGTEASRGIWVAGVGDGATFAASWHATSRWPASWRWTAPPRPRPRRAADRSSAGFGRLLGDR